MLEIQAGVRYVSPASSGTGNGSSWTNASSDLQLMINQSNAGDTIWVAAGTYKPIRPANNLNTVSITDQNNAFVLKANVKIFGGFGGFETNIMQRSWSLYITTLSGNNYYHHVVISAGNVGYACLDGFTITDGTAYAGGNVSVNGYTIYERYGGGVYSIGSSPILDNLIIDGNSAEQGGGMYNKSSSPVITNTTISGNNATWGAGMLNHDYSSPTLTNVVISGNSASSIGGAMDNWDSSPTLTNVVVKGNYAGTAGGGILNQNSSPTLTNVLISGNSTGIIGIGGGMYNTLSSSPLLTNVTVSGNKAGSSGGGISNDSNSMFTIRNGIIWGNTAGNSSNNVYNPNSSSTFLPIFYYSLVQSQNGGMGSGWDSSLGIDGSNNLPTNANPLFVSPVSASTAPTTTGDYRLQGTSPAIDKGNDLFLTITTDLEGNPRISGCGTDLGAYELQRPVVLATMNHNTNYTICHNDTATIVLSLGGVAPWQLVYTKDYGISFDTIKSIANSTFIWKVSPSTSTTYQFVEIRDYYCVVSINNNIQVNILPNTTVSNTITNDTLCHGEKTTEIGFSGDADIYVWWSSDTINGIPTDTIIGNFSQYTVLNNGHSALTTKITVLPKYIYYQYNHVCKGKDTSFFITVLPNPTNSNIPANDTLCSGEKTQSVVFSGVATSFEWSANGGIINGIPTGSQTGNFGEYIVVNKENKIVTSFIILKAKYTNNAKTCVKTDTFSITVFPDLSLTNLLFDDTLCSNEQTKAIVFSGNASMYEWTATGAVFGLPIGMQTGNFGEYSVENNSNTPLTSLVTITPKYTENGKTCVGKDTNFSITVFPKLRLTNVLSADTLCDNEQTQAIVFAGNADHYEWTATEGVSGIPPSGTDNFGAYTVKNNTSKRTKSLIEVIPTMKIGSKECEGTSQNFEIAVNPAVKIESLIANSQLLCAGDELKIEANVVGEDIVYQWYKDGNALIGAQNNNFSVLSVSKINSGKYYVEVSSICGTVKSNSININTEGENILVEKWDDVIFVDNSSQQFAGYQWYKGKKILNGATEQFYQEIGGLNGCYSVELRLVTGGNAHSCERCAYKTTKSEISIYPNPTTGKLTIAPSNSPSGGEQPTIEIYDVVGQKVNYQLSIINYQLSIDISHLANGMYFLKVDGKTVKIIKN